jgi:hypothetical protein
MSATFTELNSGMTLILDKNNIQSAYNLEEFCQLIMIDETIYDVSDTWSYVLNQIQGGPTGP